MPAPVRDRMGPSLFRGYETFLGVKQSLKADNLVDHGLPVPPPALRVKVVGHVDARVFLTGGRDANVMIREALSRGGTQVEGLERVLDWGCGCGRIARWWSDLSHAEIDACDYNKELVEWVVGNLPFVRARTNDIHPPLPYHPGRFDLAYAISVFTHLTDELASAWMREIHRVLAPGGSFFFTTHGERFKDRLTSPERARFEAGQSVVQFSSIAGSNLCAAYHPRSWVESRLLDGFHLVEVREGHVQDQHELSRFSQDRWLVRKAA
jgi:SAM-dependent methyltransferase